MKRSTTRLAFTRICDVLFKPRTALIIIATASTLATVRAQDLPAGIPDDALLKALQERGADGNEPGTVAPATRPKLETYHPTPTPAAVPESRLEALYRLRAGRAMEQFGYSYLGAPSDLTIAPSGSVQDSYVLSIGDEVVVTLRGQENSTYRQRVGSDGQVILPKLNPILVNGRTLGDFRRDLDAAVHSAYVSTNVFISLGEVHQVSILVSGEVRSPGVRVLSALASPLDAILLSGGIGKNGSLRNVRLLRDGRTRTLDLYSVIAQGTATILGSLRDGDRIYVPPLGATVGIAGSVRRPGIYELPSGSSRIRVDSLIHLAGDIEIAGAYTLTKSSLGPDGMSRLEPIGKQGTVLSGEVIFLDPSQSATLGGVSLYGAVTVNGTRALSNARTVSQLVRSGELQTNAYTPFAVIKRRDPGSNAERLLPFSLTQVLTHRGDIPLRADDTVYVFTTDEIRSLAAVVTRDLNKAYQSRPAAGAENQGPTVPTSALVAPTLGATPLDAAKEETDRAARREGIVATAEAPTVGGPIMDDGAMVNGIAARLTVVRTTLEKIAFDNLVWVLDSVATPGPYIAASGTSLQEMIEVAGGPLRSADLSSIEVTSTTIDQAIGASRTARATYSSTGNELANVDIQSFDVIRLREIYSGREEGTVTVAGQVRFPGVFDITRDEKLSSVLERAGGITEVGYPYGAIFTRTQSAQLEREGNERTARQYQSQLISLLSASNTNSASGTPVATTIAYVNELVEELRNAPALGRVAICADPVVLAAKPELDVLLQPGDSLFIPKRPTSVNVSGSVLSPGSFQFRSDLAVEDYIAAAGGATQDADTGRTFIVFPDGSAIPASSSWVSFRVSGHIPPGSLVVVPKDLKPFSWVEFIGTTTDVISKLAITAAAISVLHTN